MTAERPRCPECGAPGVPLLYGEPTWEAREAVERGRAALAGCLWDPAAPEWQCVEQEHRF